jgi:hypothetical protein
MRFEYKYLLNLPTEVNKVMERQCSRLQQSKAIFIRDCIRRRLVELGDQGEADRASKAEPHTRNSLKAYWIGFFKRLAFGTIMLTIGMLIRMATH